MKLFALSLTANFILTVQALAWGPVAHKTVVKEAMDTLPNGLKPLYKKHRMELPSLSLEPTFPEEGIDRRFAVDRLLPFPFSDFPRTVEGVESRFGEGTLAQTGRLPWLIQESYGRLVAAFRTRDRTKILVESDLLAGLVTDLHNPLALTDNSDGQKTDQHGLWARFTVRFPESLEKHLKLNSDAAHFLDDPQNYTFSMVQGTYIWLDNFLYEEDLARRGQSGYTELYYEALDLRAGHLLRKILSQAALDTGSYWYTAWTAAGRPSFP